MPLGSRLKQAVTLAANNNGSDGSQVGSDAATGKQVPIDRQHDSPELHGRGSDKGHDELGPIVALQDAGLPRRSAFGQTGANLPLVRESPRREQCHFMAAADKFLGQP